VMSPVGQNAPVDIRKPFVVLNYIIALQGIFPSRS
jgi:microcystin-dependent protein